MSPLPGATNVWVGDPIQITFSDPIDLSTAEQGLTVVDAGGTILGRTVQLSEDRRTASIQLAASPALPGRLRVLFSPVVTTRVAQPIVPPTEEWSWALPDWQYPGGLSPLNGLRSEALPFCAIMVDRQDRIVVACAEAGDHRELWVRRFESGAWNALGGALRTLAATADIADMVVRLAIGADGEPVVAWEEPSTTGTSLLASRWDGSGWTQLGTGPINASGTAATFDLAQGPAGSPVIAWAQRDGDGPEQLHAARWDEAGGAWESLGDLATSLNVLATRAATTPTLAVGGDGSPFIAWQEKDSTDSVWAVYVKKWDAVTGWNLVGSGAINLDLATTPTGPQPHLALTPENLPVVAWQKCNADLSVCQILVSARDHGAWNPLGTLNADPHALHACLAIGADGRPVALYQEYDAAAALFRPTVKRLEGTAWVPLGGGLNADPLQDARTIGRESQLALDRRGIPVAVIQQLDEGVMDVYVRRFNR